MKQMTYKIILSTTAFILWIFGLGLIWYETNYIVVLGLILAMSGDNLATAVNNSKFDD